MFGRTDWQEGSGLFAFGYHIGFHFIHTYGVQGGSCNGAFSRVGVDGTAFAAVLVDQSDFYGVQFSDSFFTCVSNECNMFQVGTAHLGRLSVSNSAFWGPGLQTFKIAGAGIVQIEGCDFVQWGQLSNGSSVPVYAVEAVGGSDTWPASGGSVLMTGNVFWRAGNGRCVWLHESVTRAVITSNIVHAPSVDPPAIRVDATNSSGLQVGLNAMKMDDDSSDEAGAKRVMLWAGHPCMTTYPWPRDHNCTDELINTMLHKLEPLRDVVDSIAIVQSFYVADPANASMAGFNAGLVRQPHLDKVVAAYKAAGWTVESVIGDIDPTLTRPGRIQQAGMKIENCKRPAPTLLCKPSTR